jgi:hypothetical protein
MQGVAEAIFDGPAGRHQGLPQNLPPEYMRKAQILAVALKMIVSDRGKIQQLHQFSGYIQHARSCLLLAHERVFYPRQENFATAETAKDGNRLPANLTGSRKLQSR